MNKEILYNLSVASIVIREQLIEASKQVEMLQKAIGELYLQEQGE